MASTAIADRTVVGLFDDFDSAHKAANELERAGIARD